MMLEKRFFQITKKQTCVSYLWQLNQAIFAKLFQVNFVDLIERYFFANFSMV